MAPDTRFTEQILRSVDLLRSRRVMFEDGLSAKEVVDCERRFGFRFPEVRSAASHAGIGVICYACFRITSWGSPPGSRARSDASIAQPTRDWLASVLRRCLRFHPGVGPSPQPSKS